MHSPEATVSPYLFFFFFRSLHACIRFIRVHACEIFAMRLAWRRACRVSVPNPPGVAHSHPSAGWPGGLAG